MSNSHRENLRKSKAIWAAGTLGLLLLLVNAAGQDIDAISAAHPTGSTVSRLRYYQINDDEVSLVEALQHENATVRWLAATALADKAQRSAIPSLLIALRSETVPVTKLNIAVALAELADVHGINWLETTCKDKGVPTTLVIRAAEHLLSIADEVCLDKVLEIMKSPSGYTQAALMLLPRFHKISIEQSQQIKESARHALLDNDGGVRIVASLVLVDLKDRNAIPVLETAVANEQEELVRTHLDASLKKLQGLQGP